MKTVTMATTEGTINNCLEDDIPINESKDNTLHENHKNNTDVKIETENIICDKQTLDKENDTHETAVISQNDDNVSEYESDEIVINFHSENESESNHDDNIDKIDDEIRVGFIEHSKHFLEHNESIELEILPTTSDNQLSEDSASIASENQDNHSNKDVAIEIDENNTIGSESETNENHNENLENNETVDNNHRDILNILLTDSDSRTSLSSESSSVQSDIEDIDFKKIVVISEGLQFAAGNDFFFDDNSYADAVTCLICFNQLSGFDVIYCTDCDLRICFVCMGAHITTKIRDGLVRINCAGESCNRGFSNQLIAAFAPKLVPVYVKNQVELENNPNRKTCPNCHKIETCHDWDNLEKRKITCTQCSLLWCFYCHAPWHSGLKCENFTKDMKNFDKKALKFWAKNKGTKTRNATKCPTCNFYIERISGCDHMTCMRCKTSFCYRCGEKYRSLGWLGDHYSTYSFLGCKYNLAPNKPVRRVAIRSCCTIGAVVGCTVLAGIALPVCAVAIVFSPIIFSCYMVNKKC